MNATITPSEILSELERLNAQKVEGFTSREFAECMGVCTATARLYMRRLFAEGRLVCVGRRRSTDISGRRCETPLYRLRKAPK